MINRLWLSRSLVVIRDCGWKRDCVTDCVEVVLMHRMTATNAQASKDNSQTHITVIHFYLLFRDLHIIVLVLSKFTWCYEERLKELRVIHLLVHQLNRLIVFQILSQTHQFDYLTIAVFNQWQNLRVFPLLACADNDFALLFAFICIFYFTL